MKNNEYQCAMCGNVYEKVQTDAEAEKELKKVFGPQATVEDSEIVCDDCYKKMGF